ncbi:MAG: YARHG domain-containing protein [Alphaproteobacteria bacterium]|nr:YARHG domain-containing protein [Alphaproteobacteria bacterium]
MVTVGEDFTRNQLCPYHRDYCFFADFSKEGVLKLNDKYTGFRLALSSENNNDGQSPSITTQSVDEVQSKNDSEQQTNVFGDYPDASIRILTPSELSGYSKRELKLMRNEIFARHGYIFKTDDMKKHFASKQWYEPQYNDVNGMLTDIEKQNINTIQQLEK